MRSKIEPFSLSKIELFCHKSALRTENENLMRVVTYNFSCVFFQTTISFLLIRFNVILFSKGGKKGKSKASFLSPNDITDAFQMLEIEN